MINGVITGREVLSNAGLIAREFGVGVLFRCVRAWVLGERTTFLQIVMGE